MLSADVAVPQVLGLEQAQLHHLLRAGGKTEMLVKIIVALAHQTLHIPPDVVDGDSHILEDARRRALPFPEQSQQQMLGAHIIVPQGPGLLLRQHQRLLGPLGKASVNIHAYASLYNSSRTRSAR